MPLRLYLLMLLLFSPLAVAEEAHRWPLQIGLIDFPPYSWPDDNKQPRGHFVELFNLLGERVGFEPQYRILPIARLAAGLQDGSVAVWPGIDGKPELADHTLVSAHHLAYIHINLYTRAQSRLPAWPNGLNGKQVILLSGYDYETSLMNLLQEPWRNILLHRTPSHQSAVAMLQRRRADYLINYQAPMRQLQAENPLLLLNSMNVARIPLQMVISRQAATGSQMLKEQLDQAWQQLLDEGAPVRLPDS